MELIKLTFVEHGGMLDQVIRPYDLKMKGSVVDLFEKATENGSQLGARRLASIAAPLLGPSGRRKIDSHIPNGWSERRIMFAMVVATSSRTHSKEYQYIIGHTDDAAYTARQSKVSFDPNMRMYFNSITNIHLTNATFRGGQTWSPKIVSHDQILNRSAVTGFDEKRDRYLKPTVLRPTDLFQFSGGEQAFGGLMGNRDARIKNLCGAFNGQLKTSTRANNSSTHFLKKGLDAYINNAADPKGGFIDDNDEREVLQKTVDSLMENQLDEDPYMEQLRTETNILEQGYITFGELMMLNPEYDEDRNLAFMPLDARRRDSMDNIVSFRSDEPESIAATMIAQQLPAILINSMYSSVKDLIIDTRARMGEDVMISAFPQPFIPEMSIRATYPYFQNQVEDVMVREVTNGGVFQVEAHIDANIDQEIRIKIRINGGEEAYFVFPAFCDALLAPTQGDDQKSFELLSRGLVDLAGGLSRARIREYTTNTDNPVILTGPNLTDEPRSARVTDAAPQARPKRRGNQDF